MAEVSGYAQVLRAIGQDLETLQIQSFELEPVGEDFDVHGTMAVKNQSHEPVNRHTLRVVWGSLPEAQNTELSEPGAKGLESSATVDVHYTIQDIERLEYAGRACRLNSQRLADASSLSQLLRCIGAYLSQKCARLLKLAREGDVVFLEYQSSLGSRIKENLSASGLYDIWVRMYLQRADRVAH